MTVTDVSRGELRWEAPGPGSWSLLADHYPRPVTAAHEEFMAVWSEATTEYMTRLGLPIAEARMVAVNGLPYFAIVQQGKARAKPPPPWVMGIVARLLPSLRRAEKRLSAVLAERPWVAGTRRWYEQSRAAATGRMAELTRIDPDSLDDDPLADHVERCRRELLDSAREHISLHSCDVPPPALLAAQMVEWGFDPREAFALLAGSSPASAGRSEELLNLRAAVGGRTAGSLDELRGLDADVAAALDLFVERHGWRVLDGYDVDCPCLVELPSLVLALATASEPGSRDADSDADADADSDALETEARARVPLSEREAFDRLLCEAREAYGLRDDNSGILVSWPAGLLRRGLLAAGTRLAARRMLTEAAHALEAPPELVSSALRGEQSLDPAGPAERAEYRRVMRAADAPRTLGPPEPPLPEGLPGNLGRVMRGFAIASAGMGGDAPRAPLVGHGVGRAPYEGRARLVTGAGVGLADFEPGDVLVATMTSPSYNVLLAVAGALVTEEGGLMSHAAIMARELDLPAVIGAAEATSRIGDGDRVVVDPGSGSVRVVGR